MRRLERPKDGAEGLAIAERLARAKGGLLALQAQLGPQASLDDARRFWARLRQQGRTPCSFLDRELEIDRS